MAHRRTDIRRSKRERICPGASFVYSNTSREFLDFDSEPHSDEDPHEVIHNRYDSLQQQVRRFYTTRRNNDPRASRRDLLDSYSARRQQLESYRRHYVESYLQVSARDLMEIQRRENGHSNSPGISGIDLMDNQERARMNNPMRVEDLYRESGGADNYDSDNDSASHSLPRSNSDSALFSRNRSSLRSDNLRDHFGKRPSSCERLPGVQSGNRNGNPRRHQSSNHDDDRRRSQRGRGFNYNMDQAEIQRGRSPGIRSSRRSRQRLGQPSHTSHGRQHRHDDHQHGDCLSSHGHHCSHRSSKYQHQDDHHHLSLNRDPNRRHNYEGIYRDRPIMPNYRKEMAFVRQKRVARWRQWALQKISQLESLEGLSDSLESLDVTDTDPDTEDSAEETTHALSAFAATKKHPDTVDGRTRRALRARPACPPSVSRMMLSSHVRGTLSQAAMHRTWMLSCGASLQRCESRKVSVEPQDYESLEHITRMVSSRDRTRLLCMWNVNGTCQQQVQMLSVKPRPKKKVGELCVDFSMSDSVIQSWCDISSLCWADISPGFCAVLYTTNSRSRIKSSAANLCFVDAVSYRSQYSSYLLGYGQSLASCWNPQRLWLAAGLDNVCHIIDAFTRQLWSFTSKYGTVLSLSFSKIDTGHLVFCGVSEGSVLIHDLRKRGNNMAVMGISKSNKGICDLNLSRDERHLFTLDLCGHIRCWDLRMCACHPVMIYDGLRNSHYRIPFHIDDTDTLLYAAGTDGRTKIWDVQSGKLLQTIAPPCRLKEGQIPAVQLCSHWGGRHGNMGMIMGVHTDFHLYSSPV